MPKWTDLTKIHENCGGIVRWVEAVTDPTTGWTGECLHCGEDRIVVEQMLPIRGLPIEDALEASREDLAELQWDDEVTWNHNQKRLASEVEDLLDGGETDV